MSASVCNIYVVKNQPKAKIVFHVFGYSHKIMQDSRRHTEIDSGSLKAKGTIKIRPFIGKQKHIHRNRTRQDLNVRHI